MIIKLNQIHYTKTEFKILELIHTVVWSKYYLILYGYIHNREPLRL